MKSKQKVKDEMWVQSVRTSPEDRRLLAGLCKKLGGSITSVTRQAWRVLAEKEGVSA
jgi:hypothetical protein